MPNMSFRSAALRCVFLAAGTTLLLPVGCGSGAPSVEGNVTFDGQPVDGGMIKFVPVDGGDAGGQVDIKGGRYASEPSWKLPPGKYRVEVNWHERTWKPAPNKSDPGAVVAESKQRIPNKYNSKSELTVDLKAGSNSGVNFDLAAGGPIDTDHQRQPARN